MNEQVSLLTQSKFYSPALNGAIFDGPLRIYFTQTQEALALKVYFALLNQHKQTLADIRQAGGTYCNIFIMIYPTADSFAMAFPNDGSKSIITDILADDHVIGIRGPLEDSQLDSICEATAFIMNQMPKANLTSIET